MSVSLLLTAFPLTVLAFTILRITILAFTIFNVAVFAPGTLAFAILALAGLPLMVSGTVFGMLTFLLLLWLFALTALIALTGWISLGCHDLDLHFVKRTLLRGWHHVNVCHFKFWQNKYPLNVGVMRF